MVKKRKTPEDDFDRLQERIWRRGRGKIKNKADYLAVYNSYLKDSNAKDNSVLRDGVFDRMKIKHKGISDDLVTKRKRAVVFTRAGQKPSAVEFDTVGKIRGKTVYSRRTKYTFKDRTVTKYRDKKGRFVHIPKKSR